MDLFGTPIENNPVEEPQANPPEFLHQCGLEISTPSADFQKELSENPETSSKTQIPADPKSESGPETSDSPSKALIEYNGVKKPLENEKKKSIDELEDLDIQMADLKKDHLAKR